MMTQMAGGEGMPGMPGMPGNARAARQARRKSGGSKPARRSSRKRRKRGRRATGSDVRSPAAGASAPATRPERDAPLAAARSFPAVTSELPRGVPRPAAARGPLSGDRRGWPCAAAAPARRRAARGRAARPVGRRRPDHVRAGVATRPRSAPGSDRARAGRRALPRRARRRRRRSTSRTARRSRRSPTATPAPCCSATAGSPADTRWIDDRADLPRIIRAGRHIARTRRYIPELRRTRSSRTTCRPTSSRQASAATAGSSSSATGSTARPAT